jgi:hypothetical protein
LLHPQVSPPGGVSGDIEELSSDLVEEASNGVVDEEALSDLFDPVLRRRSF